MSYFIYSTFLIDGSIKDAPCSVNANDSMGVELMVQAQDLVGGYEHITQCILYIGTAGGTIVHKWAKTYNHYMRAGDYYVFSSASGFKLPEGNYTVSYQLDTDNVNAGSLPLLSSIESIPQVF